MNQTLRLISMTQYLFKSLFTHAASILAAKTPVNLSYKIVGDGSHGEDPPIILLHGLLGNKKLWKATGKTITLLTKRTVIVVDIRNHGNSPHINSNKYDEMAADLVQLFDKLDIDKASIVGYDIGGRMAMCTSLIAPKRVEGIVVVDISPVSTSNHMINMIKILKAMKEVNFKNAKKVSKAKYETKKQLKQLINDDRTMYKILRNVKIKHNGVIGWGCNLDVFIKHFKQFLVFPTWKGRLYEGPTLFIGGQLSEYIPADDLTKIRELFPKAVIIYIEKTGHNLHLEDPRSFLELVLLFLETYRLPLK